MTRLGRLVGVLDRLSTASGILTLFVVINVISLAISLAQTRANVVATEAQTIDTTATMAARAADELDERLRHVVALARSVEGLPAFWDGSDDDRDRLLQSARDAGPAAERARLRVPRSGDARRLQLHRRRSPLAGRARLRPRGRRDRRGQRHVGAAAGPLERRPGPADRRPGPGRAGGRAARAGRRRPQDGASGERPDRRPAAAGQHGRAGGSPLGADPGRFAGARGRPPRDHPPGAARPDPGRRAGAARHVGGRLGVPAHLGPPRRRALGGGDPRAAGGRPRSDLQPGLEHRPDAPPDRRHHRAGPAHALAADGPPAATPERGGGSVVLRRPGVPLAAGRRERGRTGRRGVRPDGGDAGADLGRAARPARSPGARARATRGAVALGPARGRGGRPRRAAPRPAERGGGDGRRGRRRHHPLGRAARQPDRDPAAAALGQRRERAAARQHQLPGRRAARAGHRQRVPGAGRPGDSARAARRPGRPGGPAAPPGCGARLALDQHPQARASLHQRGRRAAGDAGGRGRRGAGPAGGGRGVAAARRSAGHADPALDADLAVAGHGRSAPRHRQRRLDADERDGGPALADGSRHPDDPPASRLGPRGRPAVPAADAAVRYERGRPGRRDRRAGAGAGPVPGSEVLQRRRVGRSSGSAATTASR